MKTFTEWLKERADNTQNLEEKNWIQGAVNPEHKGYCTPLSNPKCTGRRRALALRFKKGDIHQDNEKKD